MSIFTDFISNLHGGGYGLYVKVNHGNGEETVYAHLSQTLVSVRQAVTDDTIIGKVGSTGNSSGNHLHLEVRVNGVPKNPVNYIQFSELPINSFESLVY